MAVVYGVGFFFPFLLLMIANGCVYAALFLCRSKHRPTMQCTAFSAPVVPLYLEHFDKCIFIPICVIYEDL